MSAAEQHDLPIFSLGHSNQPAEEFVARLQAAGVRVVVDCRSAPYSAWATQFNRQEIAATLLAAEIRYLYAGDDLGGRPPDAEGPPDYAQMAEKPAFRQGLARLRQLAAEEPVCLMCSEEDPRKCHRSRLLAHELLAWKIDVHHLRRNGADERQSELEREATQQLSLF